MQHRVAGPEMCAEQMEIIMRDLMTRNDFGKFCVLSSVSSDFCSSLCNFGFWGGPFER
jgi:hypothetical protein